ncbi:MAG: DUF7680 family protein [Deferrisomatales bacterium]
MAKPAFNPQRHYEDRIGSSWRRTPFALRLTEWKDRPAPVLVVKERLEASGQEGAGARSRLVERGHLLGDSLRRVLPVLRRIVERVCDEGGVPFELQRYLSGPGLKFQGTLPLDEEAGAKLGVIFRVADRVTDDDRVELIARRVERFSREEAAYWFSRTTSYGDDANRWAISGMRVMLGGQPNDSAVSEMLGRLRASE